MVDFELEKKDGIICFDATIYFSSNTQFVQLPTEVHIVKIANKMEVLYLLSPDLDKHLIPDMYTVGKESFTYLKDVALVIKGHSPIQGNFVLSIHVRDRNCDPKTLKEIHGKNYN